MVMLNIRIAYAVLVCLGINSVLCEKFRGHLPSNNSRKIRATRFSANYCEIKIDSFPKHHAILKDDSVRDRDAFLVPASNENVIRVPIGYTFTFMCAEPFKKSTIQCIWDHQTPILVENGKQFNIYSVCKNEIDVIHQHGSYDMDGIYSFGVRAGSGSFFKTYETVYKNGNVYSKHQLSNVLGGCVNFERGNFDTLGLNSSMKTVLNDAYKKTNELRQLNKILGTAKYIETIRNYYIARGHLTPCRDFIYPIQQRSTFQYLNTAPQWQTNNAGNWKTLENAIRSYVAQSRSTYTIYTGTAGVMELPDIFNISRPIYLADNYSFTRVPALFWKIIINKEKTDAYAFVVLNNPYTSYNNDKNIVKLMNKRESCTYKFNWKVNDQQLGYAFCFSLRTFYELFPMVFPSELLHHINNF